MIKSLGSEGLNSLNDRSVSMTHRLGSKLEGRHGRSGTAKERSSGVTPDWVSRDRTTGNSKASKKTHPLRS